MSGIVELNELLKSMQPEMQPDDYAFCTVSGKLMDYADLNPLATFMEQEGLTLILTAEAADKAKISYGGVYKQITLTGIAKSWMRRHA